ncbi:MAG: exosortase system-associated protein, TIGR04073 family [Candidatus Omnitrophica bacterium]|nr:exosortase system-associated protein, TIGR04073 family [Candidatus Omnitrophota bacterium]
MKKFLGTVLTILILAVPSALLYADTGATTVEDEIVSYRLDVGSKAARGTKNILFGWTELPKRVVDITKESNNPIWGLLAGTFQGTLKAMARTASGVTDVVTAPIAPDKGPMMQADINVE